MEQREENDACISYPESRQRKAIAKEEDHRSNPSNLTKYNRDLDDSPPIVIDSQSRVHSEIRIPKTPKTHHASHTDSTDN